MTRWTLCFCLCLSAYCTAGPAWAADPDEFIVFNNLQLPGRLYVPVAYDPSRSYPLVTFLHGFGARGTNNTSQVGVDIDGLFDECKRREAFLYAPQSADGIWQGTQFTPSIEQSRMQQMITQALQIYSIDPDRLYLTGYSAGGGGAWDTLGRYDNQFAAGVPIAGTYGVAAFRPGLTDQPIWAFHARDDAVVSVSTTRNMIDAILGARGIALPQYLPPGDPNHAFYEWPPLLYGEAGAGTGGHGIVHAVYRYPPLYDWMFTQRLPEPGAHVALLLTAAALLRRRA